MRKLFSIAIVLCMSICVAFGQQPTYVIVHGAWGGAWQFKTTAQALQQAGAEVYRPTLTGLGERNHMLNDEVNLNTHIKDVVNTILFENLTDVILVGHSYGGIVVTGVADSIPSRIKKLVYLDAIVPDDGKSAMELLNIKESSFGRVFKLDRNTIVPLWVRDTTKTPRDVPHPIHTMTQPIRLKNQKRLTIPTTYIFTYENSKGGKEKDDFYPFYVKAKMNNWKVIELEASHNPQKDKFDDLINILKEEK